jgi:hypothetical protein
MQRVEWLLEILPVPFVNPKMSEISLRGHFMASTNNSMGPRKTIHRFEAVLIIRGLNRFSAGVPKIECVSGAAELNPLSGDWRSYCPDV